MFSPTQFNNEKVPPSSNCDITVSEKGHRPASQYLGNSHKQFISKVNRRESSTLSKSEESGAAEMRYGDSGKPIPEQASAPIGFGPQWIGGQIPNNNNGWLEEDPKEDDEEDLEEDDDEDPQEDEVDEEDDDEDPQEDEVDEDDDDEEPEEGDGEEEAMEIDDEVDNPKVIDRNEPPPPIFQFGHNFHVGESIFSSST
uniref:Uncharacterized protein n=1 Tax=Tanacetum cinerariifolium TaxID=118510 RepID=A0A6L2L471_TANCI|nr:hypothetical protein [Tanacetum cinerariifolium]